MTSTGTSSINSQTRDERVILERNGRQVELSTRQVTAENIRKMFQVNPSELWLRDETDGSAFFPSADGTFRFHDGSNFVPYTTLVVEGSTMQPVSRPAATGGQIVIPAGGILPPPPSFRPVIATQGNKKSVSIKVHKARMVVSKKGKKVEFEATGTMYVAVTESTATIVKIREAVREQWGTEYTVVSTEGFEIEDSPATQGIAFWRSPRRKLYAVTHSNMKECTSRNQCGKRNIEESDCSEGESDYDLPQLRSSKKSKTVSNSEAKMQSLWDEVVYTRDLITEMMTLSKDTDIPLGLRRVLNETFKCAICHTFPIKPPIIVTKCCHNLLGCEQCTNQWYTGPEAMTKTCPICRRERGCNETMILRGLSELMETIAKLSKREEDDSPSSHGDREEY